jgi:hypothetical protein
MIPLILVPFQYNFLILKSYFYSLTSLDSINFRDSPTPLAFLIPLASPASPTFLAPLDSFASLDSLAFLDSLEPLNFRDSQ